LTNSSKINVKLEESMSNMVKN